MIVDPYDRIDERRCDLLYEWLGLDQMRLFLKINCRYYVIGDEFEIMR